MLSSAARKRILSDLKHLQEEPIPLAAAAPAEDLSLWNGVIGTQMEITHVGLVTVPLHFLIDFPCDYPSSAPKIGFSFEFEYRGGASFTEQNGRLKGKKVICLDVLGNFDFVHTEWKQTVGSGWSPAYTVTTLLIQLQSVLSNLGEEMSQRERDLCYQSAVRFCEKNPSSILELLDEDEVRELRGRLLKRQRLQQICRGDSALAERLQSFSEAIKEDRLETFLELLSQVAGLGSRREGQGQGQGQEKVVDRNICCWSTGKLYTEAMLGVGISRERKNLATAAELLSKEAYDGGLRQNTDKSSFEFFLPMWINEAHASASEAWRTELMKQVKHMGQVAYQTQDEDGAILEVYPRLINQMIVEMMRPDASKSAAIAIFEALTNFWRSFRWLVDERRQLRRLVAQRLQDFVTQEARRHKDHCPDLGALLVLYTVLQGDGSCPKRADFLEVYADENSLRWVMWWQRSGTPAQGPQVFEATRVSREILMFQMTVLEVVLGEKPPLEEMELTNCKLPERLERLQGLWRERRSSVKDWAAYFRCIGVSQPSFSSTGDWIASCVRRAAQKGPKYGNGKGEGKGEGKGKGKGEGKGKGKGKF